MTAEVGHNFDGMIMNAVETDENGVIGPETLFQFHQSGQHVHAEYSGGRVERGYLVGIIEGAHFEFRYCQLETDGTLNGGVSICEIGVSNSGLVQIIENFEWGSRPGGGRNVIQQLEAR